MASYQEQRRMEYRIREYGTSSPRNYGDSYSTGYQNSSADCFPGGAGYAYGYASGHGQGQAQLYKAETHSLPAKTYFDSGYGSQNMYQSSAQAAAHYGSGVESCPAAAGAGGDPFCALVPSSFPPGTDPKYIDCFNRIDKDGSGFICDQELQSALSTFGQRFSLRTVHLLMYIFSSSNVKMIGPKEFVPLVNSLQSWKAIFQRFDRNRNGRMDAMELKDSLASLGFSVSPAVVRLLVSKFDKSGGKCSIEYDNFIECCLVVKGLTEKFKCKEDPYSGAARFSYEEFLLSVLPFIVA